MEPLRVLVVEDNEATRLLFRSYLDSLEGVVVCGEGADGGEGLDLIWALRPDLVLLDLVMPVMNGTELLRALRENPPPVRPGIIVVSHLSGDLALRFTAALGVDYYLTKPVNFAELSELIGCFRHKQPAPAGSPAAGRARWLLLHMGATESSLGCRYTILTVEQLAQVPAGRMLLKEAYAPAIAEGHTTRANVEKNIRDLIDKIHTAAREPYIALMGGLPARRPDNKTFLTRLADAVRGEEPPL